MKSAALAILLAACASAQQSRLAADFEHEGERFRSSCLSFHGFGSLGGCAQVLFTDHPLHIAAGSLAPQNGFGLGPAFVGHWTPNETWRLSWNADAVVASTGSWRAGGYLTAVLIRRPKISISSGGGAGASNLEIAEQPTFHAYVQNTSLNKVTFFGLGQDSPTSGKSFFGEREAVTGGNVIWPLGTPFRVALFGEMNGRFVDIRRSTGNGLPSIEQLYDEASAPGLRNQPATAQFGEGIRAHPSIARGRVRLAYSLTFQQFAAGDSRFSFRRLVTDLDHQFPLYRTTRNTQPKDFNGPDDCAADAQVPKCPSPSRNLQGSFGVRLLMTQSFVPSGHVVPFYFQPTLGGSDLNGSPALSSYEDYRFRAPNAILLRGSFEHSLYKWPVGVTFMVDEGKVAARPGDLDFSHLAHSYAAGFTLRAGGFPMVYLLFAWGGQGTHHNLLRMDTSLLGGSARPSMY